MQSPSYLWKGETFTWRSPPRSSSRSVSCFAPGPISQATPERRADRRADWDGNSNNNSSSPCRERYQGSHSIGCFARHPSGCSVVLQPPCLEIGHLHPRPCRDLASKYPTSDPSTGHGCLPPWPRMTCTCVPSSRFTGYGVHTGCLLPHTTFVLSSS